MESEITIPLRLFDLDFQAYTIEELYRASAPLSKKYMKGCSSTLYRVDVQNARWLFKVKCSKADSEGPYIVRVGLADKDDMETPVRGRDIRVHCSCPFFWYYGPAYNAFVEGYLEGRDKRGIPIPPSESSKHKIKICKHIASVVPKVKGYLLNSFKNYREQRSS